MTCGDSGGPAELVRHGVNGLVTNPTPAALADALATLASDGNAAERMGCEARRTADLITWPATVSRLLLSPEGATSPSSRIEGLR